MSDWRRSIGIISLVGGLLFSAAALAAFQRPFPLNEESEADLPRTVESLLMNLADGVYQFCTESDPQDWRDGAGACLNVLKQGTTADGYYGYPHSDRFVCLRGQIAGDWLYGEGMVVSWAGRTWSDIPQEEFTWDQEGRLHLSQGELAHSEESSEGQVSWIIFQQASLNMQGLYLYPVFRMTSPTQLCDWPLIDGEVCDDESCRYYDTGSGHHSQLSNGGGGR
ncbi:MAG: hypothetical protein QNJ46_25910 [Leptolyngbyaceae cyanobacterium MO_188.B28]|nr:hypothetical protein [Leptolyngbyaceae cyanobacterium MO_188.B28]